MQLKQVSNPDKIKKLKLDKRKLPHDAYKEVGYDKRQVIDIETNVVVTEYQAQILEGSDGKRYTETYWLKLKKNVRYQKLNVKKDSEEN